VITRDDIFALTFARVAPPIVLDDDFDDDLDEDDDIDDDEDEEDDEEDEDDDDVETWQVSPDVRRR